MVLLEASLCRLSDLRVVLLSEVRDVVDKCEGPVDADLFCVLEVVLEGELLVRPDVQRGNHVSLVVELIVHVLFVDLLLKGGHVHRLDGLYTRWV